MLYSNIRSVHRILDQAAFVKRVRIKIFGIGNTIKFPIALASDDMGDLDSPFEIE